MKPTMLKKIKKMLLVCGVLSSILYVATDILASLLWVGYSYASQSISELSAIGAPPLLLWTAMLFLYNPLLIAFGIGVWLSAQKSSLRFTGILLAVWGVLGFVWMFFPMHLRGAIGSITDTVHLVLAGVTVILILLFIGFGSGAFGKWFRVYSIGTMIVIIIFGALTGVQASLVAAQQPTPLLGILERLSVYSSMLWVLVLSIVILRTEKSSRNA